MIAIFVLSLFLSVLALIVIWFGVQFFWKKTLKSNYKISYSVVTIIILAPIVFGIIGYCVALAAFSDVKWN